MSIAEEVRALPKDTKSVRSFGLTVGGAFVVLWAIFAYALPWLWDVGGNYPALWIVGAVLIVLGAVLPALLKPIYYLWMGIAVAIGFVMTRVILTIFFFLVLTPVGLVFRLIGRDALHRQLDREADSYWIDKEYPITDRSRYEKFF
jgi:hypothetical protein